MPGTSSVRNRSQPVSHTTRGRVEVSRQEMRGLRGELGWRWFWVARRAGQQECKEATTARGASRRATLLPPRKPLKWLVEAAASAEGQLLTPADQPPEELGV